MLDGNVSEAVKSVVNEEGRLQSVLDEVSCTAVLWWRELARKN
jgi:hypothetical protein